MNQNFCRHLKNKSMYVMADVEEALAENEDGSGSGSHCWCSLTQTVVGPDDRPVQTDKCQPGRSCYEK